MKQALKTRWIPNDATPVEHSLGVVYTYTTKQGAPAAVGYAGKSTKASFHHSFIGTNATAARDKYVTEFFEGLERRMREKLAYQAERNTPHTLKPGDIVVNSWGWEQTNIDFWEVTGATAHYVELRKLAQDTTEVGERSMRGTTMPRLGEYDSAEVIRAKANLSREYGNVVNFTHGSGRQWTGRPERCSWYG